MEANLDHTLGLAQVEFNPNLATLLALIGAVAHAGADGRHEYRAALISQKRRCMVVSVLGIGVSAGPLRCTD